MREFLPPPFFAIFEFEIAEALAVVGDERGADGFTRSTNRRIA
jgi:hypothetical protein